LQIKEIPECERPREKAIKQGVDTLSNTELLAVILRQGTVGKNSLELAQEVLKLTDGMQGIHDITMKELMSIKGIKETKAVEIVAMIELSKRVQHAKVANGVKVSAPQDLMDWLQAEIGHSKQEHFLVVFLDVKNHIIFHKDIFVGSLDQATVHPREIFREAYRVSAAKIIAVHNHPSGDSKPSVADQNLTHELVQISEMMRIPLVDHIILGKGEYFSFKENGCLF